MTAETSAAFESVRKPAESGRSLRLAEESRTRLRPANRAGVAVTVALDAGALAVAATQQEPTAWLAWAYAVLTLATLAVGGAYRFRVTIKPLEDLPRLVGCLAIPLILLWPVKKLAGTYNELTVQAAVALMAVFAGRVLAAGLVLRGRRRHRRFSEPVIILGAGEVGAELARLLEEHREYGLVPIGFLDHVPDDDLPLPLLGDISALDDVLSELDVRRLIVAFGPTQEPELVRVLRTALHNDAEVHVVPRFFEVGVAPNGPDVDDVWGIPLYRVRRAGLRPAAYYVKRVFDVAVAAPLLVALSPLMGLVALAVRLTSPGPILFRQRRIGQHSRHIEVLKFRTMHVNDDADSRWTVDSGERYTPVGRFLRRTSFDELPQLWNVLRGDMSLVGPRPERPFFVVRFCEDVRGYRDRHRLPVGLTGWAQVHGLRGDTSIAERARFDNHYIEHWSLWRDVVIMVRTLGTVFRRSEGGNTG